MNEERNKNKILEDENIELNNTINKLKQDNIDLIKKYENEIISVLFMTQDSQHIFNYSIACRTTDLFSSLEERLYQDFPKN